MHKIRFPIAVFFIWKIVLTIYLTYIQPLIFITPLSQTLNQRIYLAWVSRWDAVFYLQIAWKGYQFPNQAFFPLFPIAIKGLSFFNIPLDSAAFFLNNLFALTTCIIFYLLAQRIMKEIYAKQALIYFICFPSALFLNAAYTEGLFLTVTLFSFYLYEKKQYLLAAIFSGVSAGTRIVGFVTALQFIRLRTAISKKIMLTVIAISGILLYIIYLGITNQNPLLFISAQKQWIIDGSHSRISMPFEQLLIFPFQVFTDIDIQRTPILYADWTFSILFIVLSIIAYKKFDKNYGIYALAVILIPLCSGSIMSMSRFVLVAFPAFFVLPLIIKNRSLFVIISVMLFILQLLFIGNFINDIWVG